MVVLVEVFTVLSQDRDQERFPEQIFATLAISPTEVFTHFTHDRVQQRFAELIFQTLAISLAVCTPSSSVGSFETKLLVG